MSNKMCYFGNGNNLRVEQMMPDIRNSLQYLHCSAALMHPYFVGMAHPMPRREVAFLEEELDDIARVENATAEGLADMVGRVVQNGAHKAVLGGVSSHAESFDDVRPVVLRPGLRHRA